MFEGDTQIDVSSELGKLKREIAKLCPEDAAGVDRYLADNRKKLERFKPVLESPFDRHSDVLKLPLLELCR